MWTNAVAVADVSHFREEGWHRVGSSGTVFDEAHFVHGDEKTSTFTIHDRSWKGCNEW